MKTIRYWKLLFVFAAGFIFISCNEQRTKIDYTIVQGYSVVNTIQNDGAYDRKYTSHDKFDVYFRQDSTLNMPSTSINFDNEFAAAYILPITRMETTIHVDSVIWNGKQVEMWFSIETGDTLPQVIRPAQILLIDKKYDGNVTSFVTDYKTKED